MGKVSEAMAGHPEPVPRSGRPAGLCLEGVRDGKEEHLDQDLARVDQKGDTSSGFP